MIREVIVVEGKDDEAAVKKAVEAQVLITHGFGISGKTWKMIGEAYHRCGIIILTDPDYAGENIRRKLAERFPEAKHAFISREVGTRDDDIGVENASPEAIRRALEKVRTEQQTEGERFTMADMVALGLCAGEGAAARRSRLGEILGIGYANTKTFLNRLNHYGVTEEEFAEALKEIGDRRLKIEE